MEEDDLALPLGQRLERDVRQIDGRRRLDRLRPPATRVARLVDDDPPHPRLERAAPPPRAALPDRRRERLLYGVAPRLLVAGDRGRRAAELGQLGAVQRFELVQHSDCTTNRSTAFFRVPVMVTLEDVRAVASTLPRSYEVRVRGRVKFRVGQIVWLALTRDETEMGFAFPKEWRQALVESEPAKYRLPRESDLRLQLGRRPSRRARPRRDARARHRRVGDGRSEVRRGGLRGDGGDRRLVDAVAREPVELVREDVARLRRVAGRERRSFAVEVDPFEPLGLHVFHLDVLAAEPRAQPAAE